LAGKSRKRSDRVEGKVEVMVKVKAEVKVEVMVKVKVDVEGCGTEIRKGARRNTKVFCWSDGVLG
jgi:hypothetical protein